MPAVDMIEVAASELKNAVESKHGGTATYVQRVPVTETHIGQMVWEGVISVFDLAGYAKATRALCVVISNQGELESALLCRATRAGLQGHMRP